VDKRLFTGKERDAETDLDYFGARYMRAGVGRFTTIDPAMTIEANLVDPQRWNRYAYVRNNPLRWVDPDGRNACGTNDDSKCNVQITITDRSTGKDGGYNDEFTSVKNQKNYNAVAAVSVNGKVVGTFLVKTTPSDSGRFATTSIGAYAGTREAYHNDLGIRLLPTMAIPTSRPNPNQDMKWIAQGIFVHRAGLDNFTGVDPASGRAVSEGCFVVARSQYDDFKVATGLVSPGSLPQSHFTVVLLSQWNVPWPIR
jgi:RHS repeat-associated protein